MFGVIEESGRFMADVAGPLNRPGDAVGSTLDGDGKVTTPPGFSEAYRRYVDAGWGSVTFPPEFGGGGFPWLVTVVMQEMLASASLGFSTCPVLTQGAIDMLTQHGSPGQQATFLEKMVSGEWTGTMNLTEPQAGSDLGAVRIKAVPAGDGTWRITGQKIFITFGEHDLAGNILHLVLARVPGAPPGEPSPIVEHPDVRPMLLTMKAYIEAMRALLYTNAVSIDLTRHYPDRAEREARRELADLLTPICKAWCTDLGVELTSFGLQVHGGMGYVEETGVAQYLRDSRVAPIYEGTNGIQAIDLVIRKVPMRDGGVVKDLLAQMEALDPELSAAGPELGGVRSALANGVSALREATDWIMSDGLAELSDALAGAAPYLRLSGLVIGGWLMARSALAASRLLRHPGGSDAVFLREKIATARFYTEQLLPQAAGLLPAVTAGAGPLFQVDLSRAALG